MKPKKFEFKNLAKDEMVIGGYVEPRMYGPDKNNSMDVTIDEAFDDMKMSGINTLLNTYYFLNLDDDNIIIDIIERLEKRGMNLLVKDHDNITDRSYEEAKAYFKRNYEKLEKYKAFAGLHVIDEAGYVDWEKFGRLKKAFKDVYPDKLYYINLLQVYAPAWAIPNGAVYDYQKGGGLPDDSDIEKYYQLYLDIAKPEVFSYDFYPCKGEFPEILDGYFYQLHLAYKYSKQAQIPVFCFIQCCTFGEGTRRLTYSEIMWQINMALAYNTKGLAYFCYWIPENLPHWRQAFIDWFGNKTPTYNLCKMANEFIKFVDEFVLNADMQGYMYCGLMPNGEKPVREDMLDKFGNLKSFEGGNLFIGCFDYYLNDYDKTNMYYIVNNDIVNKINARLTFNGKVKLKLVKDMKIEIVQTEHISFNIEAGCAVIVIEEKCDL